MPVTVASLYSQLKYEKRPKFNPYPVTILILKMMSAFYVCCIYTSALQTRFFHESNNMNPDQTAPLGAVI